MYSFLISVSAPVIVIYCEQKRTDGVSWWLTHPAKASQNGAILTLCDSNLKTEHCIDVYRGNSWGTRLRVSRCWRSFEVCSSVVSQTRMGASDAVLLSTAAWECGELIVFFCDGLICSHEKPKQWAITLSSHECPPLTASPKRLKNI